jgi:hypothetical protein
MSLLKHFRKKNPDGTSTHGAGVWIIVFLVFVGGGSWVFRDYIFGRTIPPPQISRTDVAKKVKVDNIADAAENVGRTSATVTKPRDEPKSDRGSSLEAFVDAPDKKPGDPTETSNTVSALDTINAAMAIKTPAPNQGNSATEGFGQGSGDDIHQHLDEGGSLKNPRDEGDELSPSYVHENADGANSQKVVHPVITKLIYHPTEDPRTNDLTSDIPKPAKHRRIFMPRGEELTVFLLNTIETGKIASFIQLGVARPAYFDGRMVMPFGAILIGASAQSGVRDRIQISVSAVRFMKDLPELSVKGIAVDPDGAVGVRAYYIPQPTLVQLAPYLDTFVTAFASYEASNQVSSVSLGAATVQLNPAAEARQSAISAAAAAINDFSAAQLKELQSRYEAHLILPAGTEFKILLTSDFDADPFYEPDGILAEARPNEALPVRPIGIDPFPSAGAGGTVTAETPESKAGEVAATALRSAMPTSAALPAAGSPGQPAKDFFPDNGDGK